METEEIEQVGSATEEGSYWKLDHSEQISHCFRGEWAVLDSHAPNSDFRCNCCLLLYSYIWLTRPLCTAGLPTMLGNSPSSGQLPQEISKVPFRVSGSVPFKEGWETCWGLRALCLTSTRRLVSLMCQCQFQGQPDQRCLSPYLRFLFDNRRPQGVSKGSKEFVVSVFTGTPCRSRNKILWHQKVDFLVLQLLEVCLFLKHPCRHPHSQFPCSF